MLAALSYWNSLYKDIRYKHAVSDWAVCLSATPTLSSWAWNLLQDTDLGWTGGRRFWDCPLSSKSAVFILHRLKFTALFNFHSIWIAYEHFAGMLVARVVLEKRKTDLCTVWLINIIDIFWWKTIITNLIRKWEIWGHFCPKKYLL